MTLIHNPAKKARLRAAPQCWWCYLEGGWTVSVESMCIHGDIHIDNIPREERPQVRNAVAHLIKPTQQGFITKPFIKQWSDRYRYGTYHFYWHSWKFLPGTVYSVTSSVAVPNVFPQILILNKNKMWYPNPNRFGSRSMQYSMAFRQFFITRLGIKLRNCAFSNPSF